MKLLTILILVLSIIRESQAQDTIPPIISGQKPTDTFQIPIGDSLIPEDLTVSDNVTSRANLLKTMKIGGTFFDEFGFGETDKCWLLYVTYTIQDEAGNTTSFRRHIQVFDNQAPVVEYINGDTIYLLKGDPFDIKTEYIAYDNYFDSSEFSLIVQGVINTDMVGGQWLVLTTVDPCGNSGNYPLYVIVKDISTGGSHFQTSTALSSLDIYPNPAREVLELLYQYPGIRQIQLEIFDMRGHTQFQFSRETDVLHESLDVSQLPTGLYWVKLETHEDVQIISFLKN